MEGIRSAVAPGHLIGRKTFSKAPQHPGTVGGFSYVNQNNLTLPGMVIHQHRDLKLI